MIRMAQRVLLLEDNHIMAQSLKRILKQELALKVDWTDSLDHSLDLLTKRKYQLLLVDWLLPNGCGLDLVAYAQEFYYPARILMLTQKSQLQNRLTAYKIGADDYLSKPFDFEELLIKVEKLLNSYKITQYASFKYQGVELYPEIGKLVVDGQIKTISPKEADLLKYLIIHHPQVLSKQRLINLIWPLEKEQPQVNTIEVYIRRIRKRLGPYSCCLKNKRFAGYYLVKGKEQ
jgi:two-component system OmpR family response regulator